MLLEPEELGGDGEVRLAGARAAHIRTVLRAAVGDVVRVGVIDGAIGRGVVVGLAADAVHLRCELGHEAPPEQVVDLLLALPRPKVLQRLWAQLAALGVGQIILTNAARVERDYFATHVLTPACYRPLLVEGLQQARDTRLPRVTVHRRFRVLVEDELYRLSPTALRLVAHPGAATPADALGGAAAGRVLLAVGPEGGWNEFELTLLEAHGFQRVGLGPRTLRSDTAVVAMLALVHDALRDVQASS